MYLCILANKGLLKPEPPYILPELCGSPRNHACLSDSPVPLTADHNANRCRRTCATSSEGGEATSKQRAKKGRLKVACNRDVESHGTGPGPSLDQNLGKAAHHVFLQAVLHILQNFKAS